MTPPLNQFLKELDLSEKEIKTYLACLELGESAIFPIARKVGIPRTSTTYLLEKLRDHQLITILQRGSRRVYVPIAPNKITTLLKNKRTKLDEQINAFELSLPELNRLYTTIPFATQVKFFKGREEIRRMYNEMLNSPINEILYVAEVDKMEAVLGSQWLKAWITRRVTKKIATKSVRVEPSEIQEELYGQSPNLLRKIRFAPKDFSCPAHILIYGDNVAIMTTAKESLGVVITSRDFAISMRSWFKELWKVSSPLQPDAR